jgi:hypothetical protein
MHTELVIMFRDHDEAVAAYSQLFEDEEVSGVEIRQHDSSFAVHASITGMPTIDGEDMIRFCRARYGDLMSSCDRSFVAVVDRGDEE